MTASIPTLFHDEVLIPSNSAPSQISHVVVDSANRNASPPRTPSGVIAQSDSTNRLVRSASRAHQMRPPTATSPMAPAAMPPMRASRPSASSTYSGISNTTAPANPNSTPYAASHRIDAGIGSLGPR